MGQHGIYMYDLNLVDTGQFNENYYNFFKYCQGLNNYDTHGPTLPCTLINPCPEECQFDMSE